MVIIKLQGGLGNQLFQYAVGRVLSYKNNTMLKIDLSNYNSQINITPRQYELALFDVEENFSTPEESKKIKGPVLYNIFKKIINKLHFKLSSSGYIFERNFNFDSTILSLKGDIYLDGYWQSWKYFDDYSDIIKKNFTLKSKYLNEVDKDLLNQIENSNSVAIHVRRGDYINNNNINKLFGVCDKSYYNCAIEFVKNKISNPKFFIFSDDPDWCSKEFGDNFFIISKHKDWQDFWLMSKCKNQIIANSSFSWWAAYLNDNIKKIVIAPQKWFSGIDVNIDDRIPKNWIKL